MPQVRGTNMAHAAPDPPSPVLEVSRLKKQFEIRGGLMARIRDRVHAVDDVSFGIGVGETLGLVGESGCGKTTVARVILRLVDPTAGRIRLFGTDITHLSRRNLRPHRRRVQVVFQDPYASLNPRLSIGGIIGEPLVNYGLARGRAWRERVEELLHQVGLPGDAMNRFPHEFSGGQRQRIGIARALALEPGLIVADEPVSALDVSVQAQVLNLMIALQERLGISYLFVSHDLGVMAHISHRVAVMYLGRIVELAEKHALFNRPLHPYTEALLESAPAPDPDASRRSQVLRGDVPSPVRPPPGCHFHTRCPLAEKRCRVERPALREVEPGRLVACHLR